MTPTTKLKYKCVARVRTDHLTSVMAVIGIFFERHLLV